MWKHGLILNRYTRYWRHCLNPVHLKETFLSKNLLVFCAHFIYICSTFSQSAGEVLEEYNFFFNVFTLAIWHIDDSNSLVTRLPTFMNAAIHGVFGAIYLQNRAVFFTFGFCWNICKRSASYKKLIYKNVQINLKLYALLNNTVLWKLFYSPCWGFPVVRYSLRARRWLVTRFSFLHSGFSEIMQYLWMVGSPINVIVRLGWMRLLLSIYCLN